MAVPEENRPPDGGHALSLFIRNLPNDTTSAKLATMVSNMGFDIEFAYVPATGSRFKAARHTMNYGFVGFFDSADIYVCLDVVNSLGSNMEAEASMKYGKKEVMKVLSRASSQLMDPSKVPVLITQQGLLLSPQ